MLSSTVAISKTAMSRAENSDFATKTENDYITETTTESIAIASLYTVPLSAVNGLSRLITTSNAAMGTGQARPIRKFSNRPTTFESNRISKLRRSLV